MKILQNGPNRFFLKVVPSGYPPKEILSVGAPYHRIWGWHCRSVPSSVTSPASFNQQHRGRDTRAPPIDTYWPQLSLSLSPPLIIVHYYFFTFSQILSFRFLYLRILSKGIFPPYGDRQSTLLDFSCILTGPTGMRAIQMPYKQKGNEKNVASC